MSEPNIKEFPVDIYGELEQLSPVLSKARCRIFYKYENRNGTYITDEFAEKLIKTLPYTPVKGIYDQFEEDYTDHGAKRELGRIYGIVPENPNFSWEKHVDEDGVEREYACADVLIFSALYDEAAQIVGKSQSMELYAPSIKGDWVIIHNKKLFRFEDACFLGLQILGENIEPCFEGAEFFTLYNEFKKIIEKYSLNSKEGGQLQMPTLNFKLSDNQKFDAIWSLLNSNYNEEGGWMIEYAICDVYDEYAIAYQYETGDYYRVYYIKNDEADSLELASMTKCYIIDVTENEKAALETLRTLNGGTYELINEQFENLTTKNEELDTQIATLTTEKDEAAAAFANAQTTIDTLNETITGLKSAAELSQSNLENLNKELEALKTFKANVELEQKEQTIASYADLLSEDVLNGFRERISDYANALELDKDLAYELKQSNAGIFNKAPQYMFKDEQLTGLEAVLSKYKK